MNIQISNVTIRQTENFYNLNDLHKAAGKEVKHEPYNWLRNAQTQELIAEIEAEGGKACEVINGGKNRGTFVCKELVYAYATWISAKFFLLVIRTFDAVVSGSPKTTKDDRTGLRQAVSALVGKAENLNHSEAYKLVHHRFNVASIEDLTHEQIPQAIEYVHRLILDKSLTGEILEKINQQTPNPPFDRAQLHDIIANMAVRLRDYGKLLTLFQRTPIADEKVCNHELCHLNKLYDDLMKLANDWQLKNTLGEPLFERNAINFYGGASIIW
ncbi:KilA-N domain-containing protein [Wielerella bovis]|uniref:KilA-N domain-containing protein n=1 Tax=Wielerella bovis TaxID=2917790 RepID=UPI00201A02BB|nr:KilA-N domain-containing protein [Wielerella bovis]MCG7657140.1 KilA-N domain-containing protein [Wielerella bovis]MCG7659363.1 KilA-N domain-containing protein [Wielerella bovis]